MSVASNVTAVQTGAQPRIFNNVCQVKDIISQMGLSNVAIKVNGQEADADTHLSDYDFVSFGEKVKGGRIYKYAFTIKK